MTPCPVCRGPGGVALFTSIAPCERCTNPPTPTGATIYIPRFCQMIGFGGSGRMVATGWIAREASTSPGYASARIILHEPVVRIALFDQAGTELHSFDYHPPITISPSASKLEILVPRGPRHAHLWETR